MLSFAFRREMVFLMVKQFTIGLLDKKETCYYMEIIFIVNRELFFQYFPGNRYITEYSSRKKIFNKLLLTIVIILVVITIPGIIYNYVPYKIIEY